MKYKNDYLRAIGKPIKIKALSGQRLICQSPEVFDIGIDSWFNHYGINKPGVATSEAEVIVYRTFGDATSRKFFDSLPGTWNQKWLSQDQVVELCQHRTKMNCHNTSFFLIKKDENRPIDEHKPEDNLVVVSVFNHLDKNDLSEGLSVGFRFLDFGDFFGGLSPKTFGTFDIICPLSKQHEVVGSLRLISKGETLTIKSLDGKRRLNGTNGVFKYFNIDLKQVKINPLGAATPEVGAKVYEPILAGKIRELFSFAPGPWEKKIFSQDQIIEFCQEFPNWLREGEGFESFGTLFLAKRDEHKPLSKDKLTEELIAVLVNTDSPRFIVYDFDSDIKWGCDIRLVLPIN
ncbi:MAG TPA: hypothetical protein PKI61_02690 [bacterium]|nr:hypothetical protein [bacterium]HPT29566.1 hypothetical protein [bacterium]